MFPFPIAHSLKCSSRIGSMAGDEPGAMQEDGEINFYFVGGKYLNRPLHIGKVNLFIMVNNYY